MQGSPLTPQERRIELVLRLLTLLFIGFAASYLVQGALHPETEFPFIANSVAKDGLFAALCFIAAGDVRQNGWAALIVIAGHVLIVGSLLFMLALGHTASVAGSFGEPFGIPVPDPTLLAWVWAALASALIIGLALLYHSAAKARYSLRYLAPHQHRTAMAMAEVLVIGDDELLTPEQVAAGIDDYLDSFTAHDKWKSKLALSALTVYPLVRLRPLYPLMSSDRRLEFIERCFNRDVVERRLPGLVRRPIQSMLFAAQQLAIIGYYADPRTFSGSGYVPFSQRQRSREAIARVERDRPGLRVRTPDELDAEWITADVAIVGSGAAGAVLADRLAGRGRDVTVLEGGRHVDPRDFSEDERVQFSALFADGGMQMSTDARFQVLQAKCVGGGTVINNAVCFDLPEPALSRWNDPEGLDAGLEEERLAESFRRMQDYFPVESQVDAPLQAGGMKMAEGIMKLGLEGDLSVVDANIHDCLGSGYCNIGCPFGKKLSALDTTLVRAQARKNPVRIVSECRAERIVPRGGRDTEIRCRLSNGRELLVTAKTVVVCGGAIASSLLLQRSSLGGPRVGRGLSFNVGTPVTGDFAERLNSFDGLQISHAYRPAGDSRTIFEAWFNPVGTQALLMPGWFRDHFENMRRYAHLACVGVVVGSARNGSVRPGFRGRGMKLDYVPTDADLRLLVKGTKLASRILFAAGAERVMPLTFRSLSYSAPDQVEELDDLIRDNTDIQLHTSHPQGGNAVSRDPKKGVVDQRFRVQGTENVYVCDSSVFPSSVTVNPQLTVMALADYASAEIS
ncbi:MAG TPA: GMC family oxidoreductase [Solirubrobacteraceae bacterium]|nr:GMC family oxidoreductase [Solirubrobacteraceae bacterium]